MGARTRGSLEPAPGRARDPHRICGYLLQSPPRLRVLRSPRGRGCMYEMSVLNTLFSSAPRACQAWCAGRGLVYAFYIVAASTSLRVVLCVLHALCAGADVCVKD